MRVFIKNKWTIIGLVLVTFGWTPFCIVLGLRLFGAEPGIDLNVWGLLLFATFWPALVCIALGMAQTLGKRRIDPENRNDP